VHASVAAFRRPLFAQHELEYSRLGAWNADSKNRAVAGSIYRDIHGVFAFESGTA